MDGKSNEAIQSGDSLNLEAETSRYSAKKKKKNDPFIRWRQVFAKYRAARSSLAAITKYSERSIPYLDIVG